MLGKQFQGQNVALLVWFNLPKFHKDRISSSDGKYRKKFDIHTIDSIDTLVFFFFNVRL